MDSATPDQPTDLAAMSRVFSPTSLVQMFAQVERSLRSPCLPANASSILRAISTLSLGAGYITESYNGLWQAYILHGYADQ